MFGDQRYGNRIPSEREHRVIELVAQGLKNREVADAIGKAESGAVAVLAPEPIRPRMAPRR